MGLVEGANTEPKHLQIYGAGTRLIKRIDNLEKLVNDINPKPSPEKGPPMIDGPMTLSEYLNTEANRLDNATQKLESLVDELRGLLF